MKQKMIAVLCALLLCIGLIPSVGANNYVMFIGLNDNLLNLSGETMPFWSEKVLYVPASTFNSSTTGINLEVYATYSEQSNTVSVYDLTKMLIFDLNDDSCYNYHTGTVYHAHAISRNGVIFIPIYMVCNFFELSYTLRYTAYGALLRITDETVELSDAIFIDAAAMLMKSRLKAYNQSLLAPPPTQTPEPPTPEPEAPPPIINQSPTYLAVRYEGNSDLSSMLQALETQGNYAVFFLSPQQIEKKGNLVRQILGRGHFIGILAEGDTVAQTKYLLEAGNRALASVAYTTTAMVFAPQEQWSALESAGWVTWKETDALIAESEEEQARYATAIVRALTQNEAGVYLTLPDSEEMGDCLANVLRQLESRNFTVLIPTEMVL